MGAVLMFPQKPRAPTPVRAARLVEDEDRLFEFFARIIRFEEELRDFSLHEIKAATGIAMVRLPALLLRQKWRPVYIPHAGGVRLWRPPIEKGY